MIDALAVAVVYCVDELHEDSAGGVVVVNVLASFGDVGEEVTFRAVLQDNIYAIDFFDDLLHSDDVGVC